MSPESNNEPWKQIFSSAYSNIDAFNFDAAEAEIVEAFRLIDFSEARDDFWKNYQNNGLLEKLVDHLVRAYDAADSDKKIFCAGPAIRVVELGRFEQGSSASWTLNRLFDLASNLFSNIDQPTGRRLYEATLSRYQMTFGEVESLAQLFLFSKMIGDDQIYFIEVERLDGLYRRKDDLLDSGYALLEIAEAAERIKRYDIAENIFLHGISLSDKTPAVGKEDDFASIEFRFLTEYMRYQNGKSLALEKLKTLIGREFSTSAFRSRHQANLLTRIGELYESLSRNGQAEQIYLKAIAMTETTYGALDTYLLSYRESLNRVRARTHKA